MKHLWMLAVLGPLALVPAPRDSGDDWTQAELERETAAILKDLEELRGEKFLRPVEVSVATKEDLLEYVKKRTAETYPPERMAADETIGKMLAALDPETDVWQITLDLLESQVAGFYDPATNSFALMRQFPKGIAPAILAHELDHALDDQLFDIDGALEGVAEVTDRAAALWCVVEGSGTNVGAAWMKKNAHRIDLSEFASFEALAMQGLAEAPQWLWKPLYGAYMQGSAFLVRTPSVLKGAMMDATSEDIRTAFDSPPRSTEQVLHPEKYWDPTSVDEPRQVSFDSSGLPDEWEVVREDILGEMLIAIVTTTPELRDAVDVTNSVALAALEYTNELASGWGGDRVVLLANGEARVMRLVTVWDTERDAAEFYGGMTHVLPHIEAAVGELNPERRLRSGATLEYGAQGEVVVTSYYGVGRRDLKKVLPTLRWSVAGS